MDARKEDKERSSSRRRRGREERRAVREGRDERELDGEGDESEMVMERLMEEWKKSELMVDKGKDEGDEGYFEG